MREFIRGLSLAEGFFHEAVEPALAAIQPDLTYSAGLIGHGSEVLGYDTERSSDHHWGPRVMIFLELEGLRQQRSRLSSALARKLPHEFRGYPTSFSEPDPNDHGVQLLRAGHAGPVHHRVELFEIAGYVQQHLAVDLAKPMTPGDWLRLPSHRLATLVGGALFRDDLQVDAIRQRFAWYPDDVWLFQMAGLWTRVGQEEHLAGRAAEVGDDLGSRLITSRLVRDVMRLVFLMERRYAPYAKWFGTAFAELEGASELSGPLHGALSAPAWDDREAALVRAYETVARMHNRLGVTEELDPRIRPFHGRPFRVIGGERFANALITRIRDPELARRLRLGGIDCMSDNTDLLERPAELSEWFDR